MGIGKSRVKKSLEAIVDSGTSVIVMPSRYVRKFAESLGAERYDGTYYLSCDSQFRFDLEIDHHIYSIPSKHLLLDTPSGEDCELAFTASEDDEFILGDPLHRAYCLVYDYAKERIGFARPNQTDDSFIKESEAIFV
jgi:hypothetical protein